MKGERSRLILAIGLAVAVTFVTVAQQLPPIITSVPLLLALAVFYVLHPDFVIYSMLFLAPFHFFVTEALLVFPTIGPGLSLGGLFQDIWLIGLIGIWMIHGLVTRRLIVSRPPGFLPLLLLGCWAITHVVSIGPPVGALFGLRNLLRFAVLPFFVPIFVNSENKIRRVFLAGFLGMMLASAISLVRAPEFVDALLSARNVNLAALPAHLRFVGVFGSADQNETVSSNSFGIALALMATYGIGRALATKQMKKKSLYLVCTAILVVFLLLTFSRRGYFTLLLGVSLLLWWWRRSPISRIRMLVVLGILFAVLVIILQTLPVGNFVIGRSTTRVLDNPSFAGRQQDWRVIFDDLTESSLRFLWGYGMASTGPAGVRFNVPNAVQAHNYYLMLWHELGLVGFALFLAMIWSILRYGFKVAKHLDGHEIDLDVWFSTIVVVALLLNGMLGTTFEAYPNDLIFWTAVSLLAASGKVLQSKGLEVNAADRDHASTALTTSG